MINFFHAAFGLISKNPLQVRQKVAILRMSAPGFGNLRGQLVSQRFDSISQA